MKRPFSAFLAFVFTMASFGVLASDAPAGVGPWTRPAELNVPGVRPGAQMSPGPDGSIAVIWMQHSQGRSSILSVDRTPAGTFGPPVRLTSPGPDGTDVYSHRIATGSDGTTAVVWLTRSDQGPQMWAAVRPPGGAFASPEMVQGFGQDQYVDGINLAVGPDGMVTVVWPQSTIPADLYASNEDTIQRAATRPPGGSFESPVDLSNPGDRIQTGFTPAAITVAPDGTTTAAWIAYENNDQVLQTATRPPGGSFGPPVDGIGEASPLGLELLSGPDGTTTAVWGDSAAPMVATRPPGGSFAVPVNVSGGLGGYGVDAAVNGDGTVVVVWPAIVGDQRIIRVTTRLPGGSFGPPVNASAPDGDGYLPSVGLADDGSVTATWLDDAVGGDVLMTSTRPSGGSFPTPSELGVIETFGVLDRFSLAVTGSGSAVVTWTAATSTPSYVNNSYARIASKPAGSADFGAANDLSTDSNGSDPSVSTGPDLQTVVAWKQSSASGDVIRSATRNPAASNFQEPVEISSFGKVVSGPEVSAGASGSAVAAWVVDAGSFNQVQVTARPGSGEFGAALPISTPGRNAESPTLTSGPDGTATVTWEQQDPGGRFVYTAEMDSQGSFGTPVTIGEGHASGAVPRSGSGPDGSTVIAWLGSTGKVEVAVRPPGGSFGAPIVIDGSSGARPPRVSIDGTGRIDLVWRTSTGGTDRIMTSHGPVSGPFSSPQVLRTAGALSDPLTASGDDRSTIAWVEGSVGSEVLRSQVRGPGGNYGDPETVGSSSKVADARVAVTPEGSVIVIWDDAGGSVKSSIRPPDGGFSDGATISSDAFQPDQSALAMGPDGEATAVWQRNSRFIQASSTTVPFQPGKAAQCAKARPRFGGQVLLRNGKLNLRVRTSGPGRIFIAGTRILARSTATAPARGQAFVKVKLRKAPSRKLRRKGSLQAKFAVRFRSIFDCPDRVRTKKVRLKATRRG